MTNAVNIISLLGRGALFLKQILKRWIEWLNLIFQKVDRREDSILMKSVLFKLSKSK
jgi:hypothetical protein